MGFPYDHAANNSDTICVCQGHFYDLAGVVGIEPTSPGLESGILPLDDTPMMSVIWSRPQDSNLRPFRKPPGCNRVPYQLGQGGIDLEERAGLEPAQRLALSPTSNRVPYQLGHLSSILFELPCCVGGRDSIVDAERFSRLLVHEQECVFLPFHGHLLEAIDGPVLSFHSTSYLVARLGIEPRLQASKARGLPLADRALSDGSPRRIRTSAFWSRAKRPTTRRSGNMIWGEGWDLNPRQTEVHNLPL